MLSYKIKYIFVIFFLFSKIFADEFYIQEPVLNSQVYINVDGNIENEPIVFVHGLGDEASTIWQETIHKLKDNYYVITFDLPGFGKSSKDNVEYTPEKYAQVLDFLVSKFLDNRQFYLVGHSMGGAISLKYATLHQDKIKKLFVIDSAGILHKDSYGEFMIKNQVSKMVDENSRSELNGQISQFATNITNSLATILPKDLSSVVRDERIRTKFLNSPTSIAALGLMTEDWFELHNIKTPTMILWGENDGVTPLRSGYVLNFLLDNSKLFIIKNSKGELKDCSYKYLKITNSNNLHLNNCNIERLIIENSDVYIVDSNIGSSSNSIQAINSNINITSSTIKGDIAINLLNSKLDIAGSKIEANNSAIFSQGINDIIFSLTTIVSPVTKKVFHKKVTMNNKEKY